MEQDARLLTFLESASLLRLADSLRAASLDEFVALLGEDSSDDSPAGPSRPRASRLSATGKVRVGARQGHP